MRHVNEPGGRIDPYNTLLNIFTRELGETASALLFPDWASALEMFFLHRTQGVAASDLHRARRFYRWNRKAIEHNISELERNRQHLAEQEHSEQERWNELLVLVNERRAAATNKHRPPSNEAPDVEPVYEDIIGIEPIELIADTKSTYRQLLRDPRWQRKRLEVFQRDNWMCQQCKATDRTLHVHHLRYHTGFLPWEYQFDDLVTLCEICHEHQHADTNNA